MEARQNPTQQSQTNPVIGAPSSVAQPEKPLSPQQLMWIDYCALGGLLTEPDMSHPGGKPMTVSEFADKIGVHRDTLYEWRKSIPNFWGLVGDRCSQLFSQTRTIKVVNSIYVNATQKLNAQAQAMWMANQKLIDFRMPTQPVKHEAGGGLADLLSRARERVAIEGEVVNDSPDKT